MFIETLEAISTGATVIDLSDRLFPTVKKLYRWLKDGKTAIAIVGAGGTGKSTLGKLLAGQMEQREIYQPYRESIGFEEYPLDSQSPGSIIVVPGQERRRDTWDELLRDIAQGQINLVIHVVAWGYHSLGEFSYRESPLYQSGQPVEEFMRLYAQAKRDLELKVLDTIIPYLSIVDIKSKKFKFLTLVTKQDLWWDERGQVKSFYQDGQYAQKLKIIQEKLGTAHFSHEFCSASLVIENLLSGQNELLKPTTQGYDERLKFVNFQHTFRTIESLLDIELSGGKER